MTVLLVIDITMHKLETMSGILTNSQVPLKRVEANWRDKRQVRCFR